jgi:hypothetical protein
MYEPPIDIPESMQRYLRIWNEQDLSFVRRHLDRAKTLSNGSTASAANSRRHDLHRNA